MSWAEVKKINSDLSTPINIANLINHIDLVGKKFIGYGNSVLAADLFASNDLYMHKIASHVIFKQLEKGVIDQEYIVGRDDAIIGLFKSPLYRQAHCIPALSAKNNTLILSNNVGNYLATIGESSNSTLKQATNINAILSNATLMEDIGTNNRIMCALSSSDVVVDMVYASSALKNIIFTKVPKENYVYEYKPAHKELYNLTPKESTNTLSRKGTTWSSGNHPIVPTPDNKIIIFGYGNESSRILDLNTDTINNINNFGKKIWMARAYGFKIYLAANEGLYSLVYPSFISAYINLAFDPRYLVQHPNGLMYIFPQYITPGVYATIDPRDDSIMYYPLPISKQGTIQEALMGYDNQIYICVEHGAYEHNIYVMDPTGEVLNIKEASSSIPSDMCLVPNKLVYSNYNANGRYFGIFDPTGMTFAMNSSYNTDKSSGRMLAADGHVYFSTYSTGSPHYKVDTVTKIVNDIQFSASPYNAGLTTGILLASNGHLYIGPHNTGNGLYLQKISVDGVAPNNFLCSPYINQGI